VRRGQREPDEPCAVLLGATTLSQGAPRSC
jgi:hypothetical protein